MRGSQKLYLLLGTGLLVMATTGAALAQSSGESQSRAQEPDHALASTGSLDEIVVTARRSAESIQSTPVSVTAFNADMLRQASIQNTQDLIVKTPGIFLAGSGGRENTIYAIRGQSKALSGNSAPGVIPYFAEVPSPVVGAGIPTYDLSSVQVLKGPQGTLFGRNTTGGAILYYPTAPNYELGGYIQGAYGNHDDRQFEGVLNLPIVANKVALRLSGQYQKRDGYTRTIGVGRDPDNVNSRGYRASLLLEPVEGFTNTTIYDYSRNRTAGDASVLVDVDRNSPLLATLGLLQPIVDVLEAQQRRGPRVVDTDIGQFQNVSRRGLTNRTEIDLADDIHLINIFGYRRNKLDYFASSDGLPTIVADGTGVFPVGTPVTVVNGRQTQNVQQLSDEVQLRGEAMDGNLDWLVGGFYLKSKPKGPSGTYVPIFTIPGITDVPFSYNFYDETSKALFANIGLKLDSVVEGLRFNAGFRYTWDKIEACVGSGVTSRPDVKPADCARGASNIVNASVQRTSSKAPTWTIGFDWQATKDVFLYAVTRRGYRTGGVNSPTLAGRLTPYQSFAPEKVTDVEIGARTEWRAGEVRGRVNVSAFSGWYNGVQIPLSGLATPAAGCSTTTPGGTAPGLSPDGDCDPGNDPTGGTLLVNAGKTRVSGIDFDTLVSPIQGLSFTAAGTLLDTKTRELTLPAVLQPYLASPEVPFNLTAKFTFSGGARYAVELGSAGELAASLDYYHTSKVPITDVKLPGYDLFNGRIDLNNVGGLPMDIGVFMRNLFNKKYYASGTVTSALLGITSAIYGEPRMYGVQLRYRFGS